LPHLIDRATRDNYAIDLILPSPINPQNDRGGVSGDIFRISIKPYVSTL